MVGSCKGELNHELPASSTPTTAATTGPALLPGGEADILPDTIMDTIANMELTRDEFQQQSRELSIAIARAQDLLASSSNAFDVEAPTSSMLTFPTTVSAVLPGGQVEVLPGHISDIMASLQLVRNDPEPEAAEPTTATAQDTPVTSSSNMGGRNTEAWSPDSPSTFNGCGSLMEIDSSADRLAKALGSIRLGRSASAQDIASSSTVREGNSLARSGASFQGVFSSLADPCSGVISPAAGASMQTVKTSGAAHGERGQLREDNERTTSRSYRTLREISDHEEWQEDNDPAGTSSRFHLTTMFLDNSPTSPRVRELRREDTFSEIFFPPTNNMQNTVSRSVDRIARGFSRSQSPDRLAISRRLRTRSRSPSTSPRRTRSAGVDVGHRTRQNLSDRDAIDGSAPPFHDYRYPTLARSMATRERTRARLNLDREGKT